MADNDEKPIEPSEVPYTIEVRVEFHGTRTQAEVEAQRLADLIGGRVTAIFDHNWEELA